ncbi:MAG: ABC transporter ATP-binding protein [Deltaproteobacteria bacterium]|nr:ABC transporter ATP-binding protein [Deltaproteobacteria bacterium]MBW2070752.1 ABC transporter ATP-binding protein [Deltaproteobacteria bacterium]
MLLVKNISAFYGNIQILHHVSYHVDEGEVVALVGGNGAGKSTLLNVISGLHPAARGSISLRQRQVLGLPPDRLVKLGLVQVPEERQIFNSMTVADNLALGAYSLPKRERRDMVRSQLTEVYRLFPILRERAQQRAGTLSGGEQQMLSIGRALMARPQMLLLDEPSLGLAPLVVREIFQVIKELQQKGTTILLVEQNAQAALEVCDRAYVLEAGRIVLEGSPHELMENDELRRAFLGKDYQAKWER